MTGGTQPSASHRHDSRAKSLARTFAAAAVDGSRAADWLFARFVAARSMAVSALANEDLVAEINERTYRRHPKFQSGSTHNQRGLFAWEQAAIERWFPRPPARLLIGGAGGGRETRALLELGYDVVAFEPVYSIAADLAEALGSPPRATICQGAYQDLPRIRLLPSNDLVAVGRLGPFHGAVMGWGSISHVASTVARASAVRHMADACPGPILLSYFGRGEPSAAQPGSAGSRLRAALNIDPGDRFDPELGFLHTFLECEIESLAREAGREVEREEDPGFGSSGFFPHAVLMPRESAFAEDEIGS